VYTCGTQYNTEHCSDSLISLILQTIITAHVMSIGRENVVYVLFTYTVCGNKKDPTTKTSISSKRRNSFV